MTAADESGCRSLAVSRRAAVEVSRRASLRQLEALEADPATMLRDPSGQAWLPDELACFVQRDAEGGRVLARLVDDERSLCGADSGASHPGVPHCDPFFTARVLEALPAPLRFTGLSPRARATLIVGVHAVGLALASVLVARWEPTWAGAAADSAHDLFEAPTEAVSLMLGAAAVLVVACVAFVSSGSHTHST